MYICKRVLESYKYNKEERVKMEKKGFTFENDLKLEDAEIIVDYDETVDADSDVDTFDKDDDIMEITIDPNRKFPANLNESLTATLNETLAEDAAKEKAAEEKKDSLEKKEILKKDDIPKKKENLEKEDTPKKKETLEKKEKAGSRGRAVRTASRPRVTRSTRSSKIIRENNLSESKSNNEKELQKESQITSESKLEKEPQITSESKLEKEPQITSQYQLEKELQVKSKVTPSQETKATSYEEPHEEQNKTQLGKDGATLLEEKIRQAKIAKLEAIQAMHELGNHVGSNDTRTQILKEDIEKDTQEKYKNYTRVEVKENKGEKDMMVAHDDNFLLNQIDEFREKAKKLQEMIQTKENKAKELQEILIDKEDKAEELQKILDERQDKADGITDEIAKRLKVMEEEISERMSDIEIIVDRQLKENSIELEKLKTELKESIEVSNDNVAEIMDAKLDEKITGNEIEEIVEEQAEAVKATVSEKIHTEGVKLYRNTQDLFKEMDSHVEEISIATNNISSLKGAVRGIMAFTLLNFAGMAFTILYTLGFINF